MKNIIKTEKRYTHILLFSVFISICLHSAAIFSLHKHLLAYSAFNKFFRVVISERKTELVSKVKKEEIFVFSLNQKKILGNSHTKADQTGAETLICANGQVSASGLEGQVGAKGSTPEFLSISYFQPQAENIERAPKISLKKRELIDAKLNITSSFTPTFNEQKENLIKKEIAKVNVAFPMQKKDNTNHLIGCLRTKIPDLKKQSVDQKVPYKEHTFICLEKPDNTIVVGKVKQDHYKLPEKNIFEINSFEQKKVIADYLRKETLKKQDIQPSERKSISFLPFVPHIPTLSDLNTISCGDDFDVDLEYVSKDEDLGYVFALTLIPKVERQFQRLNQNFYFLIDKSNSIQNGRYTSSRQALISSINVMNKKDTFNIFAFDNKIDNLFEKNKNPTHEFISSAKNFLLSKKIGTFFSSKSLTLPFNEMLGNTLVNEEINNIILISNGEDLEKQKNCRMINQWSALNNNKQSLYILALESDKNLPLLELFAAKNNGQLIVSHTVKSIRRNLVRLVKSLDYPVAKNVSVSLYEKNKENVTFFSQKDKQTHLYYDQPYVLLGTAKSLDDFVIFIQGKNPDTWFNIKKEISFANARKGGEALSDKWAQYRANQYYEMYLKDGEVQNLRKAEEILLPRNLTPAFKK